ncbi:cation:proton antiporter [Roseococcus sp. YIM B11640]|uniref:cation:proton antiporter n=1 Tax=Roseococcus sp. YIM B11640 TaxID=3133973 RepID=UPI003C7DB2A6
MSLAADILTIVAVLAGLFFLLAGSVGLLRFPDALSRLHALTKADALGAGLILVGLMPQCDSWMGAMKLLLIWALLTVSGGTVGQMIAGAARR